MKFECLFMYLCPHFLLLLQAHWIRSKAFLREQHDKGHNHMQRNRDVYPACILPGQYSDTVNSYFSEELKRLPVNTVVSPLPSLCLCIEGTSTAPETVTDIRTSVEQECSSENIIEEMDLAEQLTVNSPIASQVCWYTHINFCDTFISD